MMMPKNHPNTHHIEPYWLSDSPKGIRMSRKQTPRGYRCYHDINEQALLDDDACAHWGTTHENDLFFIQVNPFHRREFPNIKLRQIPAETFVKLRHTKYPGISYRSRVKPMLFRRALTVCKRYDVIPCFELKSWEYGHAKWTSRLVRLVKGRNSPALFMALWKMGNCLEKGKAVIDSGGEFAILAHGEKRPIGLEKGVNYTEIWGHFS
jgi:hypothetical protein